MPLPDGVLGPRAAAPPTARMPLPEAAPVPRFTPPPAPPALDPPQRPLDATLAELVPAAELPWLEAGREAFQLVRVVDGFPIARHVFTHGLIRIGRSEDCDLRVDDPLVSRYHALIERQRGREYALHDQQSSNGVKVNGRRIDRGCVLRDGDVILVGSTRLVFQIGLAARELAPIVSPSEAPTPDPAALVAPTLHPPVTPPGAPAAPAPGEPSLEPRQDGPPATPASARPSQRLRPGGGAKDPDDDRYDAPAARTDEPASAPPPGAPGLSPDEFGRTCGLNDARQQEEHREAGIGVRGYLRATGAERWSAAHLGRGRHVLITRDAFVIGAGDDVDLKVEGRLMPRVIAVIVRGVSGFSIHAVTGWPWCTKVNGRVVPDSEALDDGDVLELGGQRFTFHRGLP